MSGSSEKSQLPDVRREDLGVPLLPQLFGNKGLQFLADDCSFRFPEHQSGSDLVVDVEQFEFATKLTMISFFGFFELLQSIGRVRPGF